MGHNGREQNGSCSGKVLTLDRLCQLIHAGMAHIPWPGDPARFDEMRGGELMQLQRTISCTLGSASLRIDDVVTNVGFRSTPHVILYHINIGFPLLGPDTELVSPTIRAIPGDINPADDCEGPYKFNSPRSNYPNTVFDHIAAADEDGLVHVAIINRNLESGPLGMQISYRQAELPHLNEWKMLGLGEYVLGVEPASAGFGSRDSARKAGTMRYMEAGESVQYRVEISILEGDSEISEFEERVKTIVARA